jgi:hypothetical protein
VRVEFSKHEQKGRRACSWTAARGKRRRIPGAYMGVGNDIPHDLGQYVIEAATGYAHGFWGLQAEGATFEKTGRKVTKPGRALIVEHRADVIASEQLAGTHHRLWKLRHTSPVTEALDRAFGQWQALQVGERLVFEWPSPNGRVE